MVRASSFVVGYRLRQAMALEDDGRSARIDVLVSSRQRIGRKILARMKAMVQKVEMR